MLNQEQVDVYNHDGYLNAGPVLSDNEIAELSDELDRLISTGPDGFKPDQPQPVLFRNLASDADNPVWQVVNVWEASPAFERLVHHPFIVKAISQLTGFNNLQVWHDQMQYKSANHGGCTTWHQDAPLWPIILPMTPVSAWIPFDDADLDNGCMWMVPGSHKWGDQITYLQTCSDLSTLDQFKNPNFTPPSRGAGTIPRIHSPTRAPRRSAFPSFVNVAWFADKSIGSTSPRSGHSLYDQRSDIHRQWRTSHETVCRLTRWSCDGQGRPAFSRRLSRWRIAAILSIYNLISATPPTLEQHL